MDNGRYTANIFIDLKRAFDTVDHDILLAKLKIYGIENLELTWFTSYLTNRKQFCKVNGVCSKTKDIRCGVIICCAVVFLPWSSLVSDLYQ